MKPHKALSQAAPSGIGIKLAITVFNAALIAAVWITVLELVQADRRETLNAAVNRNDTLALALEQYTTRTIENADTVIRYLIREYQRAGRNDRIDLDKFVVDHNIGHDALTGIVLADEKGDIFTTAYLKKPEKPVNIADREHFRVHRERNTNTVFIGKPVKGRISGVMVVPVTRRINKPDGSFGGVAIALIEHTRFTDVLQDANMRRLDIISLIGLDGITRARLTGGNIASTGEDISKSPLFREQAKIANGHYAAPAQTDGIQRLFSYRTLHDYGLIATVGAAETDVLARSAERQKLYFWGAGLTSALITGFTILLILMLEHQRRAATAIARNQARFLATFNQAAVGIAHSDIDGRCLEINQKLCDITGYAREELLGRKFTEITHPEDVAASIQFRRRATAVDDAMSSLQREKRYIRKDGSVVWCLLTTSVVYDARGEIDYLAAVIQDISELKAAEKTLITLEQEQRLLAQQAEQERARLAEAQAVAKTGSWETLFPELTVTWSAETYRIFETDPLQFSPTHAGFMAFIHPEDRAAVDAAFLASLETASPCSIEHRIVMPDGRIKTVNERWRSFLDVSGKPVRAVGTCQDISDQKKAERDRAQLAAIVDSSNDAIVSRGLDGRIVSWNRTAELMFGWTAAEAIGRPAQIMSPPSHVGKFTHVLERVKGGAIEMPFETVRMRKDGSHFDAQVSLSAVKDGSGRVVGVATIVRDITERREREAIALKEKMFSDTMIESMPGIVYFYNEQGRFLRWNRNFARVSGYSDGEITGMHPLDFFAGDEKNLLERKIREVFVRGESSVEAAFLCKDGNAVPYYFTGKRIFFDGSACLIGMGVDISERKLAEAALQDYATQMRNLSWRLSEVEERERRDIHRELHDQVGATLSALKLDLGLINSILPEGSRNIVSERLQRAQQLTGETILRIRDVMADLRPAALDDYGLLAALRNHALAHSKRLDIDIEIRGEDIQPRLDISVETALFRIAQEALNNISKHAQAHHVTITVKATDALITLEIADDGTGFDAGRNDPRRSGWGLRTMRERALAIAADFRIESSPGNGTRITVTLPRRTA